MGRVWSFEEGKAESLAWVREHVPLDGAILDVGPGGGTYGRRLREAGYTTLHAVEAWEPNVEAENLETVYDRVDVCDVRSYVPHRDYDLAILGDVLEHMSPEDACAVLRHVRSYADKVLVSVPWCMPQGPVDGNPYERHVQTDLTPAVMALRYPELRPLLMGEAIGVYVADNVSPMRKQLKIAHFAPFAPRMAGLYEAARDFVRADLESGNVAALVDVGVTINGERQPPAVNAVDVRKGFCMRPTPFEEVQDYDLFVFHDGVPDNWVVRTQQPIVLIMHGQPIDCFKPELYRRGGPTYSFFPHFASWPRVKALVSLWPEFVPFWEPIVPPEKLRWVDAPPCDQTHYCPDGEVHEIKPEHRGDFNVLIATSWREVDPYEIVHGVFQAAGRIPGLKLHLYAIETPMGPWSYLVDYMGRLGIEGELCARMPHMDRVYRSMDLIVNPHRIATRIVMEGLSCGTALVGGAGCRWTPFTAPADDPEAVGEAICAAHARLQNEGRGLNGLVAETAKAFAPQRFQAAIRPIYEEALGA